MAKKTCKECGQSLPDVTLMEAENYDVGRLVVHALELLTRLPIGYVKANSDKKSKASKITVSGDVTPEQFELLQSIAESAVKLVTLAPDVLERKFYIEAASGDNAMNLEANNIISAYDEAMQEMDATVQEAK